MLNSTEFEVSVAHKNYNIEKQRFLPALKHSDVVCTLQINVKMPTIDGILTFMSRIHFMLSLVEHEKVSHAKLS